MSEHPIQGLMKTTMDSLREMIDVNTIIGDPIETKDGTLIIPISKVSIGFASGGSEFNKEENKSDSKGGDSKNSFPFGGGSGAGMAVNPVAFLVVKDGDVKLLPVTYENSLERVVDNIPNLVQELIQIFKKDKNDTPECEVINPT